MSLTIGIEGEILAPTRPTGVERALRLWLEALPLVPSVRVKLFSRSFLEDIPEGIERLRLPSLLPLALWRELRLPKALRRSGVAVLLSPVTAFPLRCPVPAIATIHELPWLEPGYGKAGLWERTRARIALRRAATVLVPSASTARQCLRLADRLGIVIKRLRVVRHGFKPLPAGEPPLPVEDRAPLLVTVSAPRERKDLPGHLALFARLGRLVPQARYVLVGPEGQARACLAALAKDLGIADRVTFPGYLPDAEIGTLLGQAALLLHAPLSEGFGFTPLEALEKNCLPCLSRHGALQEICAEAALYLDPERPELDLAEALSPEKRLKFLARKGDRLKLFAPAIAAERLARVLQETAQAQPRG